MAFVTAVVLPTRELVGRNLEESHVARFVVLAIACIGALVFAAICCRFLIEQAVMMLIDDGQSSGPNHCQDQRAVAWCAHGESK